MTHDDQDGFGRGGRVAKLRRQVRRRTADPDSDRAAVAPAAEPGDMVGLLLGAADGKMNDWERGFVRSIDGWLRSGMPLRPKQLSKLRDTYCKYAKQETTNQHGQERTGHNVRRHQA